MCEIAACNWEIITCVIVIGSLCAWDNQQGTATDKAANQCSPESTQLFSSITWVLHLDLGKLAYRLACKLHCQHPSLAQKKTCIYVIQYVRCQASKNRKLLCGYSVLERRNSSHKRPDAIKHSCICCLVMHISHKDLRKSTPRWAKMLQFNWKLK